jgi:hypothetical protein
MTPRHRSPRVRLVPLLVCALLLAGCVSSNTSSSTKTTKTTQSSSQTNNVGVKVDAKETLASLKSFSEAFPYRQSGTQTHLASRDALAKMFTDAGLEVMRQKFPTAGDLPVGYEGENVIGIKWGADRDRWVVVGAHYDVTEGAIFGTYDDGSGTILTAKLAEAFANVETNRTIAFIEFDQEERGLVGSRFFVKQIVDGSFELPNVTVDAMIDLDMVGITWPHPAHLICWDNSPVLQNKTKELATAVGVPEANLEFRKPQGGSSDGKAFIDAEIPTTYFWSDWDQVTTPDGTDLPQVVSYPFWHQADTYEGMVALAGDEATLQKGFQTTLDIVAPLLAFEASSAFAVDG